MKAGQVSAETIRKRARAVLIGTVVFVLVVELLNSGIEAAIVKTYDRRLCPHTSELIEPDVCARKALSPKPFGGTERLAWWRCCQSCQNKPELKKAQAS